MNRAVLNRAVLDCAYVGTADVGGVGVMGALDEDEVQPYISGHITDGSSTFTFIVNGNESITVPVDANGEWKWVVDRMINALNSAFANKTNIDKVKLKNVNISGSASDMFNSCTSIREILIDNSLNDATTFYAFMNSTGSTNCVFILKGGMTFEKTTSCWRMFVRCSKVVGLENCKFSNVTNIYQMFYFYTGDTIDMGNAELTKLTTTALAFAYCNNLKNLNIKKINKGIALGQSSKLTAQSVVNLFNAVAANNIVLTFHQNVWNMIMREIDVQGSPINVAYQNMIDNYDVTIANASFDAEIEYIEGTGTQWLDTNTKFNVGTSFYVKFEELAIPETPTNRTHIFGVHEGSNRYRLRRLEIDKLYFLYGNNGANWVAENYKGIKNRVCEFTYTKDLFTFVLDGTTKTQTPTSTIQVATNNNITAFYCQPSGDSNMFVGRFYAIKIWENDTLVRDMIPVRKGQVGYMYDKVSGNLFGNSGTGDFILGNDK